MSREATAELSPSTSTASLETQQHIGTGSWLFTAQCSESHAQPDLAGPLFSEGCTKQGRFASAQERLVACAQHCAGPVLLLRHLLLLTSSAYWQDRWYISQKRLERRWWRALAAGRDSTSVKPWDARKSRLRAAGLAQPCYKGHARWRPLCFISLDSKR